MKIRELFQSVGITQSQSLGRRIPLNYDNCQIENKTKNEDSVILLLKRKSDGEEGCAYLRVKNKFKDVAPRLLKWVFASDKIMGLTLNQLVNMETDFNIESLR